MATLTHICLVDPSILINWTSPFPILGVSGVLFHFLFCFEQIFLLANSEDPDQTPSSDLGLHVYICPKNGTLGLYGLIFGICLSLRKHIRSLRTTFATSRTIVVKATIFIENMLMDKLHSKASKYGNFHG